MRAVDGDGGGGGGGGIDGRGTTARGFLGVQIGRSADSRGACDFKLFPQQFKLDWRSSLFRPNQFHLDFDPPVHRLENRK
jgi:hypothetical protein